MEPFSLGVGTAGVRERERQSNNEGWLEGKNCGGDQGMKGESWTWYSGVAGCL